MAEKPGYMDWISLIASFTQTAFQSVNNSCFYLLSFWSRIVQSMNYYQQLPESILIKLQTIMVELTRCYITSYVESVPMRIEEMLDGNIANIYTKK
jgi:exportin-7